MQELHPIDKAIAAHARWKSHLRQAINTGKSDFTVEVVRPDSLCEFGKWLRERPAAEKMSEHYKTVSDLHARFHFEASHVLELALAGEREKATAAMAVGGPFANVSSKLTAVMTAWKLSLGAK
ncbi:MAG: CZB domain-containing protein [Isosphaeraceae bacterium]